MEGVTFKKRKPKVRMTEELADNVGGNDWDRRQKDMENASLEGT